ncbi:prosaposin-like isoform X2 [Dermochelys coriacea]|uniref:prosaposin-like isoform X2 n=1 Tax=Dermochelys coriacea TaxID=27794 RepID=UPI001CA9DE7F|nr:prosaposin-like isoform X2 [Dermochelys coriacea]
MAPLLLLFWLGSALCAQELVPKQCLLGPEFWCRDLGTAAQCGRQHDCKLLEQHMPQGWRIQEQAVSVKCTICTKIMKKLKSMVGDDPDKDSITEAEDKLCGVVGWSLRTLCRSVVKKFKSKIMQALQDGQDPKEICTSLKMCRASAPTQVQRLRLDLPSQAAAGSEGAPGPTQHLSGCRCLPAAGGAHPRRVQLWHQHLAMAMRPGLVHPHPEWAALSASSGHASQREPSAPLLPPSSNCTPWYVMAGMAALTPLTFASPPRFGQ